MKYENDNHCKIVPLNYLNIPYRKKAVTVTAKTVALHAPAFSSMDPRVWL